MAELFTVTIAAPDKTLYKGDVTSLSVPGEFGYFEILAHHASFMTTIGPGIITVKNGSEKTTTLVSTCGGFFEVSNNSALVLLDQA